MAIKGIRSKDVFKGNAENIAPTATPVPKQQKASSASTPPISTDRYATPEQGFNLGKSNASPKVGLVAQVSNLQAVVGETVPLQLFVSERWRGNEMLLYHVKTAQGYEVRLRALQPRKVNDVLLAKLDRAPQLEDFGSGSTLTQAFFKQVSALNRDDNGVDDGGIKLGGPRDFVAGVRSFAENVATVLPRTAEGLVWRPIAALGDMEGLLELGASAALGEPPPKSGKSNLLNIERRAQFAQKAHVSQWIADVSGLAELNQQFSDWIDGDPDTLAHKAGALAPAVALLWGARNLASQGSGALSTRVAKQPPPPSAFASAAKAHSVDNLIAFVQRLDRSQLAIFRQHYPQAANIMQERLARAAAQDPNAHTAFYRLSNLPRPVNANAVNATVESIAKPRPTGVPATNPSAFAAAAERFGPQDAVRIRGYLQPFLVNPNKNRLNCFFCAVAGMSSRTLTAPELANLVDRTEGIAYTDEYSRVFQAAGLDVQKVDIENYTMPDLQGHVATREGTLEFLNRQEVGTKMLILFSRRGFRHALSVEKTSTGLSVVDYQTNEFAVNLEGFLQASDEVIIYTVKDLPRE